jgi:Cd2+/Zn2+-exporting ATPase
VVIQTDQPRKIATAIQIGRRTRRIVVQNVILAFGVKLIVLGLGAAGAASLWEAVFADVGVALLAILNASRMLATDKREARLREK